MTTHTRPRYTLATAPRVVDGMPHLAYYDRDSALSFIWSGRLSEPIHVQAGGYGEPTVALIDPTDTYPAGEKTPAELFDWFRDTCDAWNLRWNGADTGENVRLLRVIRPR